MGVKKERYSFVWLLVFFAIINCASAAALSELAEGFFKIMTKGVKTAEVETPKQVSLFRRTPAFIRAAEVLGKDTNEAERIRLSRLFESVLLAEYKKYGITLSMVDVCEACVPKHFADNINGRAIDLIKSHDDLLIKISTQPSQILRLVDTDGKELLTQTEYRQVVDQMIAIFGPSISAAKSEPTSEGFSRKFIQSIKANSAVEIEHDAKSGLSVVSFKYGMGKVKVVNIDVEKTLSRVKYFIYGSGLASIGYQAQGKKPEAKSTYPISTIEANQLELLQKLSSAERRSLTEAAEVEYLVGKVRQLEKNK